MVFVNDKKYACETCIKGHRSSACTHTDRPLFEIKKKGRPVTQCEHCRELRKTKQVHVKCLCEHRDDSEGQEVSHSIPAKKANRKGTVVNAAFPEGLKDASDVTISLGSPQQAEKAAQRISFEQHPCACKAGGNCTCCTVRHPKATKGELVVATSAGTSPARTPSPPKTKLDRSRPILPAHMPNPQGYVHHPFKGCKDSGPVHDPSSGISHGHAARQNHGTAHYAPYAVGHEHHPQFHGRTGSDGIAKGVQHTQEAPKMFFNGPSSPSPVNDWNEGNVMSLFSSLCQCGDSCACSGCVEHRGMAALNSATPAEGCASPNTCQGCLNCMIFGSPFTLLGDPTDNVGFDPQQQVSVDDWIRQASMALSEASPIRMPDTPASDTSFTMQPNMWLPDLSGSLTPPSFGASTPPEYWGGCSCPPGRCVCAGDCTNGSAFATSGERVSGQNPRDVPLLLQNAMGNTVPAPRGDGYVSSSSNSSNTSLHNTAFDTGFRELSLSAAVPTLSRSSSSGSQSSGRSGASHGSANANGNVNANAKASSSAQCTPTSRLLMPKTPWPVVTSKSNDSRYTHRMSATSGPMALGFSGGGTPDTSSSSMFQFDSSSFMQK